MELQTYFAQHKGTGVLSTSDGDGNVDSALYAAPHFIESKTIAFIMRKKLSYANLQSNPKAAYLFIEDAPGYQGKRLTLKKISEQKDSATIDAMRRRSRVGDKDAAVLVFFAIEKVRPLVGDGK